MAKVVPILWPHQPNADGHSPIWLRFTDTHRTLYSSLGVYVHPRFWNERERRVRKGHPHTDRINQLITRRLAQAEDERLRLLTEGEPVTAEALKAAVAPQSGAAAPVCFLRYARTYVEEVGRRGNVGRYKREATVLNKLEDFAGSPLPFAKVTPQLLRAFETYLVSEPPAGLGNKASTVQGNMKVLRLHFRRAMKEGVVAREADPFFVYSPPKAERPNRHKLTERELTAVEALDLGGSGSAAPLIARVRDAFLFSLYSAGIRFADTARLRCGDVTEETDEEGRGYLRLRYAMSKTGKRMSLRLIPQAERIARAYLVDRKGREKSSDAFLFGMLDGYDLSTPKDAWNAVGAQNALHNKYLREIGKRAKVAGKLSFHISRHSFADLARRRGWDVYLISKSLGHGGLHTTEHYLAGFDGELVDRKMGELFTSGKADGR